MTIEHHRNGNKIQLFNDNKSYKYDNYFFKYEIENLLSQYNKNAKIQLNNIKDELVTCKIDIKIIDSLQIKINSGPLIDYKKSNLNQKIDFD